ncbi:MAG: hypothetical protein WCV90_05660 [Candidatus Woesearchaeota archaeon]|jgi:hypothetical protein
MSKVKSVKKNKPRPWHVVPLKSSFMALSIIGFLISVYWVYPKSINWGTAFILVFIAMFIASVISMTKAPVINE